VNHEVLNQPPPLIGIDLFSSDRALREAVVREGAGWASDELAGYGRTLGSAETLEYGALANAHPPVLHTHDRCGNRRDEVEFHPAWHHMMRLAVGHGVHSSPWANPRRGAHVARAAAAMLASECEAGHVCPISMTYSSVPVLRNDPELAREWEPRIHSTRYDPSFQFAANKSGVLIGMAMTEKQGGSDVRANTTHAQPIRNDDYCLNGHKWFCSAPMSDAFLVLAQAPGGLSCFFVPQWTADGRRNPLYFQRLKSKLGNRSNASSEVEFHGAWARRIGEEGRGVATIIEMVHHTRLDCVIGATALMRRALIEAVHHARYRWAFGRRLIDQPLMQNVLADLTIECEAATVLMMRLARAFDEGDRDFARLGVAAAKYWISKRTPAHVAEALECLGGNGFVEESAMPRLYREAPLNSIWEGSGNVIALDVLRAIRKQPEALERVLAEIRLAGDPRVEKFLGALDSEATECEARRFAERLALALQASLLIRFSPPAISDAFCASRIEGDAGRAFGTLPPSVDCQAVAAAAC
jgi:putative acyl-CoA dehydrogenase